MALTDAQLLSYAHRTDPLAEAAVVDAASQLYDLANAAFTGWAVGRIPEAHLGARLRHGAALLLASGARGASKHKLLEIAREATATLRS